MTSFVVDASVAAKWFLPAADEPLTEEALRLLERYAEGQIRFFVPDLFWAECLNVMWTALRRGRWTRSTAEAAMASFMNRDLPTIPSRKLLHSAYDLAITFNRPVYDCLYVALALRVKAPFVTADEKLANALAAHLPVKWLGSV